MKVMFIKDKQQLVDIAEKGFEGVQGLDAWDKIAEHATDKSDAARAGWRIGFYYALLSIEKGIIGIGAGEVPPSNN